jgi:aspartyl/glutamyl-tRNA(Asn/Gln) amidotransferase C subunit
LNIDIEKLETLSKIKLTDSNRDNVSSSLSEIVSFLDNLSSFDCDLNLSVPNNSSIYRDDIVFSDDISSFFDSNDKIIDNSFILPKIIS